MGSTLQGHDCIPGGLRDRHALLPTRKGRRFAAAAATACDACRWGPPAVIEAFVSDPSPNMTSLRPPELPAEVLELIFSAHRPPAHWAEPEPVLSTRERVSSRAGLQGRFQLPAAAATLAAIAIGGQPICVAGHAPPPSSHAVPTLQVRCQLVCKAWRHALDARRWPLHSLTLRPLEGPFQPLPVALWLQTVRPTVQQLAIDLERAEAELHQTRSGSRWIRIEDGPLTFDSPAVSSCHGAMLALQPPSVSWAPVLGRPAYAQPCFAASHNCTSSQDGALQPAEFVRFAACCMHVLATAAKRLPLTGLHVPAAT